LHDKIILYLDHSNDSVFIQIDSPDVAPLEIRIGN